MAERLAIGVFATALTNIGIGLLFMNCFRHSLLCTLFGAGLIHSFPAYATLGELSSDASSQNAHTVNLATGSGYQQIDRILDSGIALREYADSAGRVFAVSWRGPQLPDLKALLGKHFDTMTTAAARHPKAGRGHLLVDESDVVILSSGHMGAFEGRAWIPSLLPTGMPTSAITPPSP